jgi:hypothetical protein
MHIIARQAQFAWLCPKKLGKNVSQDRMMPMNAPINSANQARTPVTESDEALTARVDQMSPLLLALSAVHMSGDLSIIRSGLKTYPPAFNGDTSGSKQMWPKFARSGLTRSRRGATLAAPRPIARAKTNFTR